RDAAGVTQREAERLASEARHARAQRHGLVARRETLRQEVDRAALAADEAQLLARSRAAAAVEADGRLSAARSAAESRDTALRQAEAAIRRRDAESALAQRRAQLAAAEEQAARRRDALARAAAVRVDAEAVARLTALERAADRARAELDAASLTITFEPDRLAHVAIDGRPHDPAQPLALSRDATLDLEGFGRLRVQPGGGTAELLGKLQIAERALRDALAQIGAATLSEARHAAEARSRDESEAAALARTLAALAPKGLEVLRQAVGDAAARLGVSPDGDGSAPDANTLARLREVRDLARAAIGMAEQHAKTATAARQAAATEAAILTERRDNARRQFEAATDDLAAARVAADDDLLASRATNAEAALADARGALAQAGQDFAAADAEVAQLALERARTAEREIRRDLADLETQQRDLRVELRALGQDGLSERLSAMEGEIEAARSRLRATEREAAASRLLHETLLAAQRESKERWLGPVRARVAPYLRLIHPDSEIRIDDRSLEIEGLFRGGVLEEFSALSMGAREQVAVVPRLALADILRGAGHPAAVILDDALVNTDDARLERMRNVLARAARGLQILIFTCRERDFLGLGATHRI
ncbi:MAG: hypothetical protein INR64_17760, partial [Caulobacteraceae bacterium]|nr:hypothetical protein [Caulobacter sp.]